MRNEAIHALIAHDVHVFGIAAGSNEMLYKGLTYNYPGPVWRWTPSETDWFHLSGAFDSPPVSAMPGYTFTDRLDVFGLGLDDAMYHMSLYPLPQQVPDWKFGDGAFNGPLDAKAYSGSKNSQSVAIVGLGTNNSVWLSILEQDIHILTPEPRNWEPLGGVLIEKPVIVERFTYGELSILGVGTDRQMWRLDVDVKQWPPKLSNWMPLGGCFIGAPSVVQWNPTRWDVFCVGSNNEMLHRGFEDGIPVGAWEDVGGTFNSAPAVVSWGENRLDIFGLGTDDQMYHKAWYGDGWDPPQRDWEPLGGQFISAPTAVANQQMERLDIFGLGTDSKMYHKAWDGSRWLPSREHWDSLGAAEFQVPRSTRLPDRLDFDANLTFPAGFAVGGTMHVTLFSDGNSTFSGHLHDSGALAYNCKVGCTIVDNQSRAYRFREEKSVAGTFQPGSRDADWEWSGRHNATLQANWSDLFSCGGSKFTAFANVNVDWTGLFATIAAPMPMIVIDITSK